MRVSKAQLDDAWRKVRRGSRSPGVDGITVELFTASASEQLERLRSQLEEERYFARPAKGFYLRKPSGGRRLIGLSTVRDRIVQRWLLNRLHRVFEDAFSDSSYAYRPGRNIHQAAAKLAEGYGDRSAWVLKADIEAFFDSLRTYAR